VLVEVRQLLVVFGASAAPAQACDIHTGQYHGPGPVVLAAVPLLAQAGDTLRAPAGPAGTQARPAALTGGPQPGQPDGVGHQLGNPAPARDRHDGPDPAAGQGQPLPRPVRGGIVWPGTHDSIFPRIPRCARPAPGANRALVVGRGVPDAWVRSGQVISLANFPTVGGRHSGLTIRTAGSQVTLTRWPTGPRAAGAYPDGGCGPGGGSDRRA
jgi:hypothetical protein